MDESVKKYFEDMLQSISEIEMAENRFGRQYEFFENDVVFRKFVERNIEILGGGHEPHIENRTSNRY